jgi:hypothetical protein
MYFETMTIVNRGELIWKASGTNNIPRGLEASAGILPEPNQYPIRGFLYGPARKIFKGPRDIGLGLTNFLSCSLATGFCNHKVCRQAQHIGVET